MRKVSTVLSATCLLATLSDAGFAQEPPLEAVALLVEVHDRVSQLGAVAPGQIWPGFRPDTVPVLYLLPDQGTLLLGWDGPLPDGYNAISGVGRGGWLSEAARGAASTSTQLAGRGAAQVVVHSLDFVSLVGITVHEDFHVFQRSQRQAGRRFGGSENSFLVTSYPIFDVGNEARVALEGQLLAASLEASAAEARRLAHEFLAVRESRQRKLGPELAEFESMAELNEGLAQYAGIRALQILAEAEPKFRSEALAEARDLLGDLDGLISEHSRSFRLRFYSTGPAISLLLDRTSDADWKTRLVEENLTLQDALAEVAGYRQQELALRRDAETRLGGAELVSEAESVVTALRERRKADIDSVFAQPGVRVLIYTDDIGGVGFCGIDPQNLHQVDDGVLFHTRWFKPCRGSALQAEFNTPVVHDQKAGTLAAVIGNADQVTVTAGGERFEIGRPYLVERATDVSVEAPGLSLRSALARLESDGANLTIRPLKN